MFCNLTIHQVVFGGVIFHRYEREGSITWYVMSADATEALSLAENSETLEKEFKKLN